MKLMVDYTEVTKKNLARYYACEPYIYEFIRMLREQMCEWVECVIVEDEKWQTRKKMWKQKNGMIFFCIEIKCRE